MQEDKIVLKLSLLPLVLLACCSWMNKVLATGYLPPRLSVDANAGGSATLGKADLLLSIKGDEQRNIYLDPQAAYGSDGQWYADLGLGYRWIQNDAAILGGYVYASRTQAAKQSSFWIANPGLEALGSRWDARINGYIPINGRSDEVGRFEFIQSRQFVFSGHAKQLLTTYIRGNETQQIGDGVDAKVAYQLFPHVPLKGYLGGYFFDIPNSDNVRGGAAGLEYWMDRNVKIFANYTYDNLQHGTVVGGLAVSFGGVDEPRADPSLSERLTDPVERYLANSGHGSGIPSETLLTNLEVNKIRRQTMINNVAFFSQTGKPNNGGVGLSLASCTFENPCAASDFTRTGVNTLNTLLPNTMMFFNGGTYPARDGSSALTLNNGQGVFGMNASYSAAASGAARSTFNGAFILNGNNTLDSIILNNSLGANTTAISSSGGQDLVINNTAIGSATTPYGSALNLTNNASATLSQSSANLSSSSSFLDGITVSRASSLVVQTSDIKLVGTDRNNGEGIHVENDSSLQFISSQLTFTNPTAANLAAIIGISSSNSSTVLISDSTITVNGNARTFAIALYAYGDLTAIKMSGNSIVLFGDINSSTPAYPLAGASIELGQGVTCMLNGALIAC
jgi:hypothetical protein